MNNPSTESQIGTKGYSCSNCMCKIFQIFLTHEIQSLKLRTLAQLIYCILRVFEEVFHKERKDRDIKGWGPFPLSLSFSPLWSPPAVSGAESGKLARPSLLPAADHFRPWVPQDFFISLARL